MRNLYWLTEAKMLRLWPYFPKNRGWKRWSDRHVLGGHDGAG